MSAIWSAPLTLAGLLGTGSVEAQLNVGELPRVGTVALPDTHALDVRLNFSALNAAVLLEGRVAGRILVRCQRCLEPLEIEVDGQLALALAANDTAAAGAPEGFETVRVEDGSIRIVELVEDEILLAVPLAARHRDGQCGALAEKLKALGAASAGDPTTPFAGLGAMLGKKRN